MSLSAETLRQVLALDLDPERLKKVISIIAECQEARPVSSNAERQAAYRARKAAAKAMSVVTSNVTSNVTPVTLDSNENITLDVTSVTPEPSRVGACDARVLYGEEFKEEKEGKEERKKDCSASAECGKPASETDLLGDVIPPKNLIAARQAKQDLENLGEKWNEIAGKYRLPSIDFIHSGSQRERHAVARLHELREGYHVSIDDFLAKIVRSPFLRGETKAGFKISFDWVCNPANFTKIMEGNYENQRQKSNGTGNGYAGRHA